MKVIDYGKRSCERVRGYLDSYLSNELLVETNHEVIKHLEGCVECSAELNERARVRSLLRDAVRREAAPARLEQAIRARVRESSGRSFSPGYRWLAVAAAVVICVGVWGTLRIRQDRIYDDVEAQNSIIRTVAAKVSHTLGIGLKDHIHCSVYRRFKRGETPTVKEVAEKMEDYAGLAPIVAGRVPEDYRLVLAHRCEYMRRDYVHLTFKRGSSLMSLVITRRQAGESFQADRLLPALLESDIPIYRASADRYQIAGFESRDHLVYVVSDMGSLDNLTLTAKLAAPVKDFLADLEG
jgi:hypothetical protein